MSWTLMYAHNDQGDRIAGDKDLLIDAIKGGKNVRIVLYDGEWWIAVDAQGIWVQGNNVYAQNTALVSVDFNNVPDVRFLDETYRWMLLLDTQGNRDMIRWNVGEHVGRGHTQDRVEMKWFVG